MAMTPQQAAQALLAYRKSVPAAVTRGMRAGLRKAEALSKTKYMQRKDNRHGRKGVWDPPNPPPGPLAIRQANLARTVKITDIRIERTAVIGGLQAGNAQVLYAAIHEKGGRAGRGRRSLIPARPYLLPALKELEPEIERAVRAELQKLALATLRGLARPA